MELERMGVVLNELKQVMEGEKVNDRLMIHGDRREHMERHVSLRVAPLQNPQVGSSHGG